MYRRGKAGFVPAGGERHGSARFGRFWSGKAGMARLVMESQGRAGTAGRGMVGIG